MRRTRFARTVRAWLVAGALGVDAVAAAQTAATPHVAALHADPAAYDQPSDPAARAQVAHAFYRAHADAYDFLVLFPAFPMDVTSRDPGETLGRHWAVRNAVSGIGLPLADFGGGFGSASRLKGVIDVHALVPGIEAAGPDVALGVVAHEILHQWSSYVSFRDPRTGAASTGLLGRDGAHWSYFLDSDASVMYGADWRDAGGGRFVADASRKRYSALDLYLMGVLDASEVPPFSLLVPGAGAPTDPNALPPGDATSILATAVPVTIADVVAASGPRVPGAATSQRVFRAAFAVVTPDGVAATPEQLALVDQVRREWANRFFFLTRGRAVMETDLVEPPPQAAAQDPSARRGLDWLLSAQRADGSWADDPATAVRDSGAAVEALAAMAIDGATRAARDRGVAHLGGVAPADVDSLARRRLALAAAAALASRDLPLPPPNADGGHGLARGYASTVIDSALAALAARAAGDLAQREELVAFLLDAQRGDGGWGYLASGGSQLLPTAWALRALAGAPAGPRLASAAAAGLAFVRASRRPDGSYGDDLFSTASSTAEAVLALDAWGALSPGDATEAATQLLASQLADGSWAESVAQTAEAVRALRTLLAPNLVVEAVALSRAAVVDGEPVDVAVTVRNAGHGAAGAFRVRVHGADGTAFPGDGAVDALPGGEVATVRLTLDTHDRASGDLVYVVADADGAVDESREDDNRTAVALRIAPAPELPDLYVVPGSIVVTPAAIDTLPAAVHVTARVANAGRANVGAAAVLVRVRGAPAVSGTIQVFGRSSELIGIDLTVGPGPAPIVAEIVLDPDGVLPEANEANNRAEFTIPVLSTVDLAVAALRATPGQVEVGDPVTFAWTLGNSGTLAAAGASDALRIVDASGAVVAVVETRDLAIGPGGTLPRAVTWKAAAAGALTATVRASHLHERDPSNNQASVPFAVGPTTRPNLAVGAPDLTVTPEPAPEGGTATARLVVRNTGSVPSGPFDVVFHDGAPAAGRVVRTARVADLAGGATATLDAVYAVSAQDLTVVAQVDPAGTVDEFDETDNLVARTVPVVSLPDLAIGSGAIAPSTPFPRVGEQVAVAVTVSNLGGQRAGAGEVTLHDGDPANGGVLVGTAALPALDGGTSAGVTFSWTARPRGTHVLAAEVRAPGTTQRTTANDRAERSVPVQDADLALSNPFFSPNGDGVKDTTELVVRVDPPAPVRVEIQDPAGAVVRTLSADAAGIAVGWDGRDAAGRLVRDGAYALTAYADGPSRRVLGTVTAVVDLNRSPLVDAAETPFRQVEQLPAGLATTWASWYSLAPMPDDDGVVVWGCESDATCGIYEVPLGGTPTLLTPPMPYPDAARPYRMGVSPDRTRIAYATCAGALTVFSIPDRISTVIDIGADQARCDAPIVWSPEGDALLYQTHRGVELRTLATNAYRVVYDRLAAEFTFSPDGGRISVVDWSGRIRVYPRDGSAEVTAAPDESIYFPDVDPGWRHAWTNDGKGIAFAAAFHGISYVDLDTLEISPLFVAPEGSAGQFDAYASMSANARELAVAFVYQPGQERGGGGTEVDVVGRDGVPRVLHRVTGNDSLSYVGLSPLGTFGWVFRWPAVGDRGWDVLTSLANLTARVAATRPPGATEMTFYGTAEDLNFERLELGVRRDGSASPLQTIAASTAPVVDQVIARWTPPADGIYEAVLSVFDKAGNVRTRRTRFAWSSTPAIANVTREPEYISPNADGVQDAATIRYAVTRAVTTEFVVKREGGAVVRRLPITHVAAGAFETAWDGTDDAGYVVDDGSYTLEAGGIRRRIVVDTVKPKVEFAMLDRLPPFGASELSIIRMVGIPRPSGCNTGIGLAWGRYDYDQPPKAGVVLVSLSWKATDANLKQWWVESGAGLDPLPGSEQTEVSKAIPLSEARRRAFQLRAVDLAGNEAVTPTFQTAERAFAITGGHWEMTDECRTGWAGLGIPHYRVTHQFLSAKSVRTLEDSDEQVALTYEVGQPLAIVFDHSIRRPIVKYELSYRLIGDYSTTWPRVPVRGVEDFGVVWSPPVRDPAGTAVRVHLTDDLGRTFDTQSFVIGRGQDPTRRPDDPDCATSSTDAAGDVVLTLDGGGLLEHSGDLRISPTDGMGKDVALDAAALRWLDDMRVVVPRALLPGCSFAVDFSGKTQAGLTLTTHRALELCSVQARDLHVENGKAYFSIAETMVAPIEGVDVYVMRDPARFAWDLATRVGPFEGVSPVVEVDLSDVALGADIPLRFVARLANGTTFDTVPRYDLCPNPSPSLRTPDAVAVVGDASRRLAAPQRCVSTEALYSVPVEVRTARPLVALGATLENAAGVPVMPLLPDEAFAPGLHAFRSTFSVTTALLPPGEYVVAVEATDDAGFVARGRGGRMVVDRTPPLVTVSGPEQAAIVCAAPDAKVPAKRVIQVTGTVAANRLEQLVVQLRPAADPVWQDVGVYSAPGGAAVRLAGNLLEADVTGRPGGDYVLRVEARDAGGAAACTADVPFHLGAGVSLAGVAARPGLFAPDGDGAFETTAVGLVLDETADVTLAVADPGSASRPIATTRFGAGPASFEWDGSIPDGGALQDGPHVLSLAAADRCGGTARTTTAVELDRRPPDVAVDAPRPGATVGSAGPVLGSVFDAHLAGWRLSLGEGAAPAAFVPFTQGGGALKGALGAMPLAGLAPGPYTLRAEAWDAVGHATVVDVPFTWAPRALIEAFEVAPVAISPNGDGVKDGATGNVRLAAAASVTLDLLRPDGSVAARAVTGASAPAGPSPFALDAAVAALPDGPYDVRVTATAGGLEDSAVQPLLVDRVRPTFDVTSPARNGFVRGAAEIAGSVDDDRGLDAWTVCLRSGAATTQLAAGGAPASGVLARAAGLADGPYTVVAVATDRAGNRREELVPFTSDTTPPEPAITAPLAGAFVSSRGGPVLVTGTLVEANPGTWRLQVATSDAPGAFRTIAEGTAFPGSGVLAAWDVGAEADGPATLRLTAVDAAGNERATERPIVIDRTPPSALIAAPRDVFLQGGERVEGTASDANLAGWTLELSDGSPATAHRFVTIGSGTESVTGGTLATLVGQPAEGAWTLRLTATDRAGNVGTDLAGVVVDRTPPAPPSGLVATLQRPSDGLLTWQPSPSPDVVGYRLVRAIGEGPLAPTGPALIPGTSYVDPSLRDGTYRWAVIAVDAAGLVSVPSAEATLEVDTRPPMAIIARPRAGARVHGLLDVEGSAYADRDFREYRLSAGPAAAVQLVRRATGVVLNGVLGTVDTTAFAEETQLTIRLEAEDLAGNVAEAQTTVVVDNLAPPAPVLTSAVPQGEDVVVTWQPVDVPDLAGYLVWRNGVPLGMPPGADLGTALRYVIPAGTTTFVDPGVPDGSFEYRVQALDLAANASELSNAIGVTLDRRAPRARIVSPAFLARLAGPVEVVADVPDQDVASVQLEAAVPGSGAFVPLGPALTAPPWIATLDPGAFGAAVEVRARATDAGGNADPSPEPTFFLFAPELRPPVVTTHVDESLVTVAFTEPDAAGSAAVAAWAVFHPGERFPVNASAATPIGTATASSGTASLALDASESSCWRPVAGAGAWWQEILDRPRLVERVTFLSGGGTFDVLLRVQGAWVPVALRQAPPAGAYADVVLAAPIGADAVRLRWTTEAGNGLCSLAVTAQYDSTLPVSEDFTNQPDRTVLYAVHALGAGGQRAIGRGEARVYTPTLDPLPPVVGAAAQIVRGGGSAAGALVRILAQGAVVGEGRADASGRFAVATTLAEGNNALVAQATDDAGNRSRRSAPATVRYERPPEVALTLALDGVAGSDVSLSFTVSGDLTGVGSFELLRDGAGAGAVGPAGRTFADRGVPNGTHAYRVRALSPGGLAGAVSNEVQAVVDVRPPEAPVLAVAVPPVGAALDLSWTYGPAARFRIDRAVGAEPFAALGALVSGRTYRDGGLRNGTTYRYRVTAVDSAGNAGPPSNEASGVPRDVVAPERPVITEPTVAGAPISVADPRATIAGTAELNALVEVRQNGRHAGQDVADAPVAQVRDVATSRPVAGGVDVGAGGEPIVYVSSDAGGAALLVVEWPSRAEVRAVPIPGAVSAGPVLAPDASRAALVVPGEGIVLVRTDDGTIAHPFPGDPGGESALAWSPAGRQLAYTRGAGGAGVLDVETGIERVLAEASDATQVRWIDGASLGAITDRGQVLRRYDVASGAASVLATRARIEGWFALPAGRLLLVGSDDDWTPPRSWLLDGSTVLAELDAVRSTALSGDGLTVAALGPSGLRLVELASGSVQVVPLDRWLDPSGTLAWPRPDRLVLAGRGLVALDLRGRFEVPILLDPGLDRFVAIARDAAGNLGAPSDPIEVTLDGAAMPDLATSLVVTPAAVVAGEPATAVVTVRNVGGAPSAATDLVVRVLAADPSAERAVSLPLPPLDPGRSVVATAALDLTGLAGEQSVRASADPARRVPDASRANNDATGTVRIVAGGVTLEVAVAPRHVGVGGAFAVRTTVANGGADADLTVRTRLVDVAGVTAVPAADAALALARGGVATVDRQLPVGTLLAGDYAVVAEAVSGSAVVASRRVAVVVDAERSAGLRLASARARYRPDDPVELAATATNLSRNAPLDGATVRFVITDATGAARLALPATSLPVVWMGGEADVGVVVPAGSLGAGAYAARGALELGGTVLAEAVVPFEVTAEPLLAGALAVAAAGEPPVVRAGEQVPVAATLRNVGTGAALAVRADIVLVAPDGAEVTRFTVDAGDLPASGQSTHAVVVDAATLPLGTYGLVLVARYDGRTESLATARFRVADGRPPELAVGVPGDGAFVQGSVQPVVRATDDRSGTARVRVAVDGGPALGLALVAGFPLDGTWSGAVPLGADGPHTLVFSAADAEGNDGLVTPVAANPVVVRVVSDTIPPALGVTGVAERVCYAAPPIPVVEATDLNLATTGVTLDGVPFVSGTRVALDGDHTLSAEAADRSGNRSAAVVHFVVDGAPPAIAIGGAVDGAFVSTSVVYAVTAVDPHLTSLAVSVNGRPAEPAGTLAMDGAYVVTAHAADCAGNASDVAIAFTIDTVAPVLTISGVTEGAYVRGPAVPEWVASDANLASVSATLSGTPIASGTPVVADGDYLLDVVATDRAGNSATRSVAFVVDATAPAVAITGFVDGSYVASTVYPAFVVADANLVRAEATLDGVPFVEGLGVTAEGLHVFTVRAADRAGNETRRAASFTIDRTPPEIVLGGFTEGAVSGIVSPAYTVTDDNLSSTTALLDGRPFASGTAVAAEGAHVLVVHAVDLAGNASDATGRFTVDLTAPRIVVAGVVDGEITARTPAPVVSIEDANLVASTVTLDGAAFAAGTAVGAEGDHVLAATARDAAGLSASATVRFAVDRTPPTITFSGVAEGGTYPGGVAPGVAISDAHLASSAVTLDGAPFVPGTPVVAAGAHVLAATARDAAGNSASAQVAFTVGGGEDPGRCPAPEPLGARLAVFQDAPVNCFEVGANWGDNDLEHHTTVHAGTTAIAFDPSSWSMLKLERSGLRARWAGLEFWVSGGATGAQTLWVDVTSGPDRLAVDVDVAELLGGPIRAGTWVKVTVPFRMPTHADGISIRFKGMDGELPAVYVDDVALLAEVAGTCEGTREQPCSDGDACNGLERCDGAGTCVRGLPPAVDDGNPCTVDTCDPVAGVSHAPAEAGRSCLVEGACDRSGACDGSGACQPTTSPAQEAWIYDDRVATCFEDASNALSYDPYQLAVVHGGAHALRWEPFAWSQLTFVGEDLGASFDAVELWIHGGAAGGQTVEVLVDDGRDLLREAYLAEDVLGHPVAPGTWERVRIPFVRASQPGWIRLTLQAIETGGTLYVDDVRLVRGAP